MEAAVDRLGKVHRLILRSNPLVKKLGLSTSNGNGFHPRPKTDAEKKEEAKRREENKLRRETEREVLRARSVCRSRLRRVDAGNVDAETSRLPSRNGARAAGALLGRPDRRSSGRVRGWARLGKQREQDEGSRWLPDNAHRCGSDGGRDAVAFVRGVAARALRPRQGPRQSRLVAGAADRQERGREGSFGAAEEGEGQAGFQDPPPCPSPEAGGGQERGRPPRAASTLPSPAARRRCQFDSR